MPKTVITFSEVLTRWLADRGLTGPSAAALLGTGDSTIYNWLHGETLPPSTRLPALAKRFGMPLADLQRIVARDRRERAARAIEDRVAAHRAEGAG